MFWKILIGILVFFVIVIIIKRRKNKMKYGGDIWEQARNVKRGACAKLKELLWGC